MARQTYPFCFLLFSGANLMAASSGVKLRAAEKQKTKMK
jgi:hypothetical protein